MRYENSWLMVIKCMQWIIKHTSYLRYLSKIDSVPRGSMLTFSIAQSTTSRGESGFAVLPVSRKFTDFKQIWQKTNWFLHLISGISGYKEYVSEHLVIEIEIRRIIMAIFWCVLIFLCGSAALPVIWSRHPIFISKPEKVSSFWK